MRSHLSDYTRILGQARMSRNNKVKSGWSRLTGAGFIKEDINDVKSFGKEIEFEFGDGRKQKLTLPQLSLREVEELIEFCKSKVGLTYHEIDQRELDKRYEVCKQ